VGWTVGVKELVGDSTKDTVSAAVLLMVGESVTLGDTVSLGRRVVLYVYGIVKVGRR